MIRRTSKQRDDGRDVGTRRKTRSPYDENGRTTTTKECRSASCSKHTTRTTTRRGWIPLISRPTPSRRLSLIHGPQLFPRPRSGDERTGKQVRPSPVSSVARRAAPSRTLSSHHLIPSCSAAYPHHRRHLSKRAVFGSSFDAHAVIAPPRRAPGKNALRRPRIMASHQGIHPNAPPHDKQDEAKDRTRGWRAVPLVASPRRASLSRCPVLLVVSFAVPPHIARRGFPSRGGGNSRGGHIFRAVFLSSSYPPRLIASSVPRLSVPSWQASRQGKTAGGHRRFSPPSSYLSPVIVSQPYLVFAPSRPSCRRAGRRASRSRRFRAVIVLVRPSIVRRG